MCLLRLMVIQSRCYFKQFITLKFAKFNCNYRLFYFIKYVLWYAKHMSEKAEYRSHLGYEDFIVDKDENSVIGRQHAEEVSGAHIVGKEIAGRYFDETNISLEPNSTIVIISDNIRARDELVKVIAGEIPPQKGVVTRHKNSRVEYVTATLAGQEIEDMAETSIQDVFFKARGIYGMEERMYELYSRSGEDPKALESAGELQADFEQLGGYDAAAEAAIILEGLEISANDHDVVSLDTDLGALSSGQISKAIIGRALFSRAEIIVMDDPTVHLDVRSKEWLAWYINQSKQTIVVATSDIEFAERIATKVVEVTDTGPVIQCATDFPTFISQRDQILAYWKDEAELKLLEIQEKRAHIRDFLGPLAARSSSMGQAKRTTENLVARLESEYDRMPGKKLIDNRRSIKDCAFEIRHPSKDEALKLRSVNICYASDDTQESQVISLNDIVVNYGDKLALIGRNGSGKSTLLKAIAGKDDDLIVDGTIEIASNAASAYYSPYTSVIANADTTVHEALRAASDTNANIGQIMEYWGFKRSEYYNTRVSDITHQDEIARLQLAIMMSARPNLLILDEPTSYLTPIFRDRLIRSLEKYTGTMLVVSHDPHFLAALNLNGTLTLPSGDLQKEDRR